MKKEDWELIDPFWKPLWDRSQEAYRDAEREEAAKFGQEYHMPKCAYGSCSADDWYKDGYMQAVADLMKLKVVIPEDRGGAFVEILKGCFVLKKDEDGK